MAINKFELPYDIFPNPENSEDEGLVAYGGSLEPEVLLSAYLQGIFPWYSEPDPILWWSPNPRLILYPKDLKVSKSLKQKIRSAKFTIRFDTAFEEVIHACATVPRPGQEGTWITEDMVRAYMRLHALGYAHSVEVFLDNRLVGGLYGLTLGRVFCGESMFHKVPDASKTAFYYLCNHLRSLDYAFIDAQTPTDHLKSLGAIEIERKEFLKRLKSVVSLDVYW
ncbi:MAG: leucyl/phenylalanyl-tRNA--protein transferase [Bacteroidota bacterium]